MTFTTDYKAFYQGAFYPVQEIIWEDQVLTWVKIGETKIVPASDVILCINTKQYDKNDVAIYTHDVLKVDHDNAHYTGVVTYLEKYASFTIKREDKHEAFGLGQTLEVTGNDLVKEIF